MKLLENIEHSLVPYLNNNYFMSKEKTKGFRKNSSYKSQIPHPPHPSFDTAAYQIFIQTTAYNTLTGVTQSLKGPVFSSSP